MYSLEDHIVCWKYGEHVASQPAGIRYDANFSTFQSLNKELKRQLIKVYISPKT